MDNNLYTKLMDIINNSSNNKEVVKLYSNVDKDVQLHRIVGEFKSKEEAIVDKVSQNDNTHLTFDMDKNIKDLWAIMFLRNYIVKIWKEKRSKVLEEYKKTRDPNLRPEVDKWNRYLNIYNDNSRKLQVDIISNNYNLTDKELKAIKEGIILLQRLKNSLSHKNNELSNIIDNMYIDINNPQGLFEGLIPCKYLDILTNDKEVEYYSSDEKIVKDTNLFVDNVLKNNNKKAVTNKKFKMNKEKHRLYKKVDIDWDFLHESYSNGKPIGISDYATNVIKDNWYRKSSELLKTDNIKIICLITYMESVLPFYQENFIDEIDVNSPLNIYKNDLIHLRNVSSHHYFNEVKENDSLIELYDQDNNGITWGPKRYDIIELMNIIKEVENFINNKNKLKP